MLLVSGGRKQERLRDERTAVSRSGRQKPAKVVRGYSMTESDEELLSTSSCYPNTGPGDCAETLLLGSNRRTELVNEKSLSGKRSGRNVRTDSDASSQGRQGETFSCDEIYRLRGPAIDLGDLVCSPAYGVKQYDRVPTFVSCKDALQTLKGLPESLRCGLAEVAFLNGLMATDDCDNLDYEKELG